MGIQKLRSIENNTPASATDVSFNFGTIESFVNNNLVNTDGSVPMVGQLVLAGNPTADRHAVSKEYVDAIQPVGMIVDFAGAAAPSGWLLCNGAVVNRGQYPALFTVCGAAYNTGGEGGTQFRLPDFRGKSSVHPNAGAVGMSGGSADVMAHSHTASGGSHSHTSAAHNHTMPSHSHTLGSHSHSINHNHGSHKTVANTHTHSTSEVTINSGHAVAFHGGGGNLGLSNADRIGGEPFTYGMPMNVGKLNGSANGGSHDHSFDMPEFTGNSGGPSTANTNSVDPGDTDSTTPVATGAVDVTPTISTTGAGADNYHPYLLVNKIIKAG